MNRPALLAVTVLLGVTVAACGDDDAVDAAGSIELASPKTPEPGQEFELRLDPTVTRSLTWILSRDGKALYWLAIATQSAPPHYGTVDPGNLDLSSVAVSAPTETLTWPDGLNAGTYELCNADPDDLCLTITIPDE